MRIFNQLFDIFTLRRVFATFSFVAIACLISGCQEANVSNKNDPKAKDPELSISSNQGASNDEVLKKLEEFGKELGKINEIREELTVIQNQLNASSGNFIDPSPESDSGQFESAGKNDSTLFDASAIGDRLRVKELLTQGTDVNSKDENGQTALHHAATNARSEIARLLIEAGANINQLDNDKLTPLNHAYFTNNEATIAVLLENNAIAAEIPNLENNPETDQKELPGSNSLEVAAAILKDDPGRLDKQVKQGFGLDSIVTEGQTVLNASIKNGSINIVKYLLEKHRAHVEPQVTGGNILDKLHSIYADSENEIPNQSAIAKLLIKGFPGSINELQDELAPLHVAIANQDTDLLQFLLNEGANTELKGPEGVSPLIMAISVSDHVHGHGESHSGPDQENDAGHGHQLEMVKLLLSAGADVHKRAMLGRDAIVESIRTGRGNITRTLLQFGANPNSADDEGVTCLHYAAYLGQSDICNILLSKGANRDAVVAEGSKKGLKPIDAARDGNRQNIVLLLDKK